MAFFFDSGGAFTPAAASLYLRALTHSYILFNVVPYEGYMAVALLASTSSSPGQENVTTDSAGLYAGLLGTAFALGRTLGFAPWRSIRSSIGEKASLIASLVLSAFFSALFGLSSTFSGALAARFLLGLSNGVSGAVKRAALNNARVNGDEDDVEKAPARILAIMSWGCVLGPALGGALSNPIGGVSAANRATVEVWGWWDDESTETLLDRRPFLLPNLLGALLCTVSAVMVWTFVKEGTSKSLSLTDTFWNLLPSSLKRQRQPVRAGKENLSEEVRPLLPSDADRGKGDRQEQSASALADVWKGNEARRHLVAYWSFSFVAVCIDEALPLFLIARLGGPGLSALAVGLTLAGAGMVLVLCQRCTFQSLLGRAGLYRLLRLAAALGTIPGALIPLSLALNRGTCAALMASLPSSTGIEEGGRSCGLAPLAFAFLVLLAGFLKLFSAVFFAVAGMATGRTVPPTHHDEVARIMTMGALFARSVAPTMAGALVSFSMSPTSAAPWYPKYGSVAVWSVIGLVLGLFAAALAFSLTEASSGCPIRKPGVPREDRRSLYLTQRQRAQVYVKLWEVHYDRGSDTVGAKWRRIARKAIALNRFKGAFLSEPSTPVEAQKERNKRISLADRMLRTGVDPDEVPFFIMGTHKNDESCKPHVLSPPLMDALHKQLPYSCSQSNFWLKYSLVRDGASIDTLAKKISLSRNAILAIETMDGDVFGSFHTKPWEKTDKYEGGGQSFLWRIKRRRPIDPAAERVEEQADLESDIEVFRWTGDNDLCQLLGDDRIAVGGGLVGGGDGFGLVLDSDLAVGSSSPCLTYDNPCLCPGLENGRFEVANVEVWSMTPFLLVADAERSERSERFVKDNIGAEGDWSNYF